MFLSIGRSLRRGFGLRLGFRGHGWTAIIMAIAYATFYMCWWSILGSCYLVYALCYVVFYLPIKGIQKLIKNKKPEA